MIFQFALQLIFNLSFDSKFRAMVLNNEKYFKRIADCFKIQDFRGLVLRILYNLSLEEKSKALFGDTDCVFIIYELIINFPDSIIGIELAALTLNITTHPENAKKLASGGRIKNLLERAFKNFDFHLIKIVKNILKYSEDDTINEVFDVFIDGHFMKILKNKTESIEFLKETFEILSYIDTNWDEKLAGHSLIPLLEKYLMDEKTHDELLLPIILFLGNISSNIVK
jgi:hypothetical protein